jgi:predicted metal-dependent hydrolase
MQDKIYKITDCSGREINLKVRRDSRLKKTSHWEWLPDGTILLRVPHMLPNKFVKQHIREITAQLERQGKLAERRTDSALQKRAQQINKKYFGGAIQWNAIRWVSNMNTRLGSCTNGGSTDGHIRISDKIKHWPRWVVDYVIAHELVHRLHANHSEEFWRELTDSYPMAERARGFITGVGFAEGIQFEDT